MIEHLIANTLLADAKIQEYCGGNVFAVFAPDGTRCPYMVITESDAMVEDDVVATFDIRVEIYDFAQDKRPLLVAGKRIKDLLHWKRYQNDDVNYSAVRVWFESREHIKESDTTLSRLFMMFSARACENLDE